MFTVGQIIKYSLKIVFIQKSTCIKLHKHYNICNFVLGFLRRFFSSVLNKLFCRWHKCEISSFTNYVRQYEGCNSKVQESNKVVQILLYQKQQYNAVFRSILSSTKVIRRIFHWPVFKKTKVRSTRERTGRRKQPLAMS